MGGVVMANLPSRKPAQKSTRVYCAVALLVTMGSILQSSACSEVKRPLRVRESAQCSAFVTAVATTGGLSPARDAGSRRRWLLDNGLSWCIEASPTWPALGKD